jgi:hypothetical protein
MEDIFMTKDRVVQPQVARIKSVTPDGKKKKKPFMTPELKRLGSLQDASGQPFIGTFSSGPN